MIPSRRPFRGDLIKTKKPLILSSDPMHALPSTRRKFLNFASFVENPGPFQEFKGQTGIPFTCDTSSLTCQNGTVRCPSGPGFGIKIDPDYVRQFRPVKQT